MELEDSAGYISLGTMMLVLSDCGQQERYILEYANRYTNRCERYGRLDKSGSMDERT